MTLITSAARIPFTQHIGVLVLALTGWCFYGATVIRLKTMLLTRGGRKTALMKVRKNEPLRHFASYLSRRTLVHGAG